MSYLEEMIARQQELAQALLTDGQTEMAPARTAAAPAKKDGPDEAAQEETMTEAGQSGAQAQPLSTAQAQVDEPGGAEAMLQALSFAQQQAARTAALRQKAMERESRQIMERLGVKLSEKTPQTSENGLVGGFETTMTVAGLASTPTARSMEEISRFFERDARRYGA